MEREHDRLGWKRAMPDELAKGRPRDIDIQRPGRMVLDPLAEVGIGVLVTVVVGCGQLVMDILRHGKRRQAEQDHDHRQRDQPAEQR